MFKLTDMKLKKAQQLIGQCIRLLREQRKFTLESLSHKAGITYQYLSGIENGKENFSISVLEALSHALKIHPKILVAFAYENNDRLKSPKVKRSYFRPQGPLPPGLTIDHIEAAANQATYIIHRITQNLFLEIGKPLHKYIQGNNFSGLVSNIFSDALNDNSPYKHNHNQRYPDLINKETKNGIDEGLEVKATINIGKGGESHNGHSGWHTIACYELAENGDINFVHVMFAYLNGHRSAEPDWKYLGSRVNDQTGSRRTETYITNAYGTTKLRDGSIYLDLEKVNYSRWRPKWRTAEIPKYSIFSKKP